mgnify:CR=1 FL=1
MFDSFILKNLIDGLFAGFVSVAFAMLFAVPSRYLTFVALAGFMTKALRTFLYNDLNIEIACATLYLYSSKIGSSKTYIYNSSYNSPNSWFRCLYMSYFTLRGNRR